MMGASGATREQPPESVQNMKRSIITIPILIALTIFSRGIVIFVLYGLPVAGDLWYAVNRDRRYKYVPFKLTRSLTRVLFGTGHRMLVAPPQAPVPPIQQRRGVLPRELRRQVYERDGGRCQNCGSQFDLQYDHIIPFSMGGATSVDNLQLLCGTCNQRKKAQIDG